MKTSASNMQSPQQRSGLQLTAVRRQVRNHYGNRIRQATETATETATASEQLGGHSLVVDVQLGVAYDHVGALHQLGAVLAELKCIIAHAAVRVVPLHAAPQ